jgi:Na+-transporting NADH:ubiquinone oxidoreductase subunit NqrC
MNILKTLLLCLSMSAVLHAEQTVTPEQWCEKFAQWAQAQDIDNQIKIIQYFKDKIYLYEKDQIYNRLTDLQKALFMQAVDNHIAEEKALMESPETANLMRDLQEGKLFASAYPHDDKINFDILKQCLACTQKHTEKSNTL